MKTKEVKVEVSKSKNYQTYKVSKKMLIEKGDDEDLVTQTAQAWCRKRCMEQIELDKP